MQGRQGKGERGHGSPWTSASPHQSGDRHIPMDRREVGWGGGGRHGREGREVGKEVPEKEKREGKEGGNVERDRMVRRGKTWRRRQGKDRK